MVYKYHIIHSSDFADWSALKTRYAQIADQQEKNEIVDAMTQVRVPWILNSLLDEMMATNSIIKDADFFSTLTKLSQNPVGRYIVWYFYRNNWEKLVERLDDGEKV
jgi:hypothetical protein